MKQSTRAALLALAFGTILLLGWARTGDAEVARETPKPALNHAQMVWSYALEWCESHGVYGAINPKDRDGTPSYGGYQFKPGTLAMYAKIYAVAASSSVMDYATQRAVLEAMVLDQKHINWHQQFPECVRKLGLPPK